MTISERDRDFLRLSVGLAREARQAGDDAFGTVLVGQNGDVLFSDRNRVVSGSSPLRHPEFAAAQWAVTNLDPLERSRSTVYTSGEHCPMCAAAHGWAGLGRIVYASSAAQFKKWATEDGQHTGPVTSLRIQDVVPGVVVDGPDPDLSRDVRELHRPS
ncbi:Putative cytosine/adenosine deaminase [Corynebacterium glyciniphilum AJ 3170]|uniref:Putative cytosine/adenosine deaminase n=1 Tax=Corynebacterium glyciniphilum AJ 3170 TaxID=1404245 RepID=X5EAA1_9CORY|nr:nucleoside deaminase [Corynebacterium glyciniphilum]AHW64310.1 Putative cytosine/adenosine deaminase [Corynebacterium glyciniphilum AJ 3170]